MNDKIIKIKQLTNQLNMYRNEYYNNSNSVISDYEAGKLAEWSEFWDVYQHNGSLKIYDGAFNSTKR